MPYTDEDGIPVQEKYRLITPAEGRVALTYADANGGDLDAAVAQVVSERCAPYNTEEYQTMRNLREYGFEGPAPSIGAVPSIGDEHSVTGLDPAAEALATDLTTLDPNGDGNVIAVDPDSTQVIGQYETGPDGPVIESPEAAAKDAAEEAKGLDPAAEAPADSETKKKGGR